jgi:hypothetical protein
LNSTIDSVQKQISAMPVEIFEIGLFRPSDPTVDDRSPVMILRAWDAETLLRSTPWLRYENRIGRNIYIRPSGEHQFSLVDDVSEANIEVMKRSGFHPAAIVETSPGNFQGWLNHGRPLPKELGTAAARALAEQFGGDIKAADWRHFGRLAGFTNQKEKHRQASGLFPYVRLTEAAGGVYPRAETFLSGVERRFQAEQQSRRERLAALPRSSSEESRMKSIEVFRRNPVYGGDGTRSDLSYTTYAVSRGCSPTEIKAALRSRDLSHKGNERRQESYIDRTIRKALSLLEHSR